MSLHAEKQLEKMGYKYDTSFNSPTKAKEHAKYLRETWGQKARILEHSSNVIGLHSWSVYYKGNPHLIKKG